MEVVNVSSAQDENKENIIPTSPLPSPPTESSPDLVPKKKTVKWRRMRLPLRDITHLFNSPEAQSSLPSYQSVDIVASDSNARKRKATEDDGANSLKHRHISRSLRMGFR